MFEVFLQDLSILDLGFGFGFLVNNSVYSRLETSRNPQFGQTTTKLSFGKVCFVNLLSGLHAFTNLYKSVTHILAAFELLFDAYKLYSANVWRSTTKDGQTA